MRFTTLFAVMTACTTTSLIAQTERDLDSHEHGAATLNVAIDGSSVLLELESPWNNLVGFEHAPGNSEQHKLVDNAMALLDQPDQLFSFSGGDCTVAEAMVESSLGDDDDHHDDHDDDHKEHDDEHSEGEEHHDDHDDDHKEHDDEHAEGKEHHDHDDHDSDGETHSEVLATYTFNCSDIGSLSAIEATFMNVWSGFEDLDVQLIGPGGQSLVELNPEQTSIDTTQVQ